MRSMVEGVPEMAYPPSLHRPALYASIGAELTCVLRPEALGKQQAIPA